MGSTIVDQSTKRSPVFVIVTLLLVILPLSVIAQPPAEDQDPASAPAWHITADRMSFNQDQDTYEAEGNVLVTREGRQLTADRLWFNRQNGDALAQGNVRLVSGNDWLQGSRLELNLNTEVGRLKNGSLFIDENHFYFFGDEIRKTGKDTYWADHATFTTCDGSNPAWKITGSDLAIRIEGYGTAKHATLWAKKLPVLYTPYLVFPVKSKRQSGLLMPEMGYADRKGIHYLQPVYWAINEQSDATFYPHYMSERGFKGGLEYRYVLSESSKATLMADGFTDSRVDDGEEENSRRWGYEDDAANDVLRPNEDRYWLRAKMDQALPGEFKAKLDLDVVSDQDYLLEFRDGLTGFNQSRNDFLTTFGRDLDDYNDPERLNRLNLNRTWRRFTLDSDLRWNDNVIKRRQFETNDTLQQLPAVTFDGLRQPLADSPFSYDLKTGYTYFFRESGSRGHRSDLYPRLYYPFFVLQGISLEPSVGLRHTAWYLEHDEAQPQRDGRTFERSIYDLQMVTKTEFFRVFDLNMGSYDRLKHAVVPEISYEYLPDDDQSDLPEFETGVARIARKNLITYSLTNFLTVRRPAGVKAGQPVHAYNTFLRLRLENSFDVNEHHEADGEPFGDIKAELDITPGRFLSLDGDASWSPYDAEFQSHNATLSLWDARGDRLGTTYRYTRETTPESDDGVASIILNGRLVLNPNWRLRGAYDYDLYTDKEVEARLGVSYQAQCWSVDLDYIVGQTSRSYVVMFHLAGLGSIGQ